MRLVAARPTATRPPGNAAFFSMMLLAACLHRSVRLKLATHRGSMHCMDGKAAVLQDMSCVSLCARCDAGKLPQTPVTSNVRGCKNQKKCAARLAQEERGRLVLLDGLLQLVVRESLAGRLLQVHDLGCAGAAHAPAHRAKAQPLLLPGQDVNTRSQGAATAAFALMRFHGLPSTPRQYSALPAAVPMALMRIWLQGRHGAAPVACAGGGG